MRIGLLSPWASRAGGGVFEAVVAQAMMLADFGAHPVVFALNDEHSEADRHRFGNIPVHLGAVTGPRQIGWSPELDHALATADLDILHLHGIWMATSHHAARWAKRTRRPLVISPHGMLDPWITARGRVKKLMARVGYERRSWANAALFHALTGAEAVDIAHETGRDTISVIPNAVSSAPSVSSPTTPTIVYLGRIHRKKNIDALIDGWLQLVTVRGATAPRLIIAGWGDAEDVGALKARVANEADPRLAFIGPVFGLDKATLIAGATALALPSHSEGLPMVILEAWAAGVPTAMSRHCNLPEGFACGAAIDCGTEPATIATALATLIDEGASAHSARASAARRLVAERFSGDVVRDLWKSTYNGLLK